MSGRWSDERLARAALLSVCGVGSVGLSLLVQENGAMAALEGLRRSDEEDSAWARRARTVDPEQLRRATAGAGARFLIPGDEEWPRALQDLDAVNRSGMGGAPLGLWVRGPGHLAELSAQCVAIVGTRVSSSYGNATTAELAADLSTSALRGPGGSGHEWTIVSGGAYGVDACAHRAALAAGGRTFAVVASGVDRPYPAGNSALLGRIGEQTVLVSEVPPGGHPTKQGFLARNRLIAALSAGTVVVEASNRSGALNTAAWAGDLGRVTMAVPGPVTSSLSAGPLILLREGRATLVRWASDVLELLEPFSTVLPVEPGRPVRPLDGLDPDLVLVHEALPATSGCGVDQVVAETGLRAPTVLSLLTELGELGLVSRNEQGLWRVQHAHR